MSGAFLYKEFIVDVSDTLWASNEWEATSIEQHAWLSQNKHEMNEITEIGRNDRRFFVPRDYQWPLLCVTVYESYPARPLGVLVAVSYKVAPDGWFTDCNLPRALVSTLIEMLKKVER